MKSIVEIAQRRVNRGDMPGRATHAVLIVRIITDEENNEGGVAIFVDGDALSPMAASLYLDMLEAGQQGIIGMVRDQASSN